MCMKLQEELNRTPFFVIKFDGERKSKKYSLLFVESSFDGTSYSRQGEIIEDMYIDLFSDNKHILDEGICFLGPFNTLVNRLNINDCPVIISVKVYINSIGVVQVNVCILNRTEGSGLEEYIYYNCNDFIQAIE